MLEDRLDVCCSTLQLSEAEAEIVEIEVTPGGSFVSEWSLAGHAASLSITLTPSAGGGAIEVTDAKRLSASDGPFPFRFSELAGAPLPAGTLRVTIEAQRCKGESWRGKVALRYWSRVVPSSAPLRERTGLDGPCLQAAPSRDDDAAYETNLTQQV